MNNCPTHNWQSDTDRCPQCLYDDTPVFSIIADRYVLYGLTLEQIEKLKVFYEETTGKKAQDL